jgi:S-methylmethionine-dependent homocysteine/selenocysteine methylase
MIAAIGSPEGENVQNQCSRSVMMPISSADEVTPNDSEAGDHTGQLWDPNKSPVSASSQGALNVQSWVRSVAQCAGGSCCSKR